MNLAQQALQAEVEKMYAEEDDDVIQDGPYAGWQIVHNEKFMMPAPQQPQQWTRLHRLLVEAGGVLDDCVVVADNVDSEDFPIWRDISDEPGGQAHRSRGQCR
jgi:hypothetical protein